MKDMVSIPLFQRAEAGAYSNAVQNVKFNPTEYYSVNADEWTGKDTVVLAFTQEPASMFSLVESAAVQRTVALMVGNDRAYTQYDYGYQTTKLEGDEFPTIENGGATNTDVELKDGDRFVATDGSVYALKDGKVVNLQDGQPGDEEATGIKVRALDGTESDAAVGAKVAQIVVTWKYKADKWSDGEPVKKADRELGFTVDCDRTSGAVTYDGCDRIASFEVPDDNTVVQTYVPGNQAPFYYLPPGNGYPSHVVIESEGAYKGKTLAEVAPKDFATLPEIAELPHWHRPVQAGELGEGPAHDAGSQPQLHRR